jgi:hypothetical protein
MLSESSGRELEHTAFNGAQSNNHLDKHELKGECLVQDGDTVSANWQRKSITIRHVRAEVHAEGRTKTQANLKPIVHSYTLACTSQRAASGKPASTAASRTVS